MKRRWMHESRMTPRRAAALLALALAGSALATEPSSWPDLSEVPAVSRDGAHDAAVIVAIEDYAYVADVPGARDNGGDWARYLDRRGVPLSHVHKLFDASANPKAILRHANEAAQEVGPDGRLWFVFIGHGAPSRDGKDGLLVAAGASADADGIYDNSVSRTELLHALGSGATDDVLVVLDACFSGQTGPGQPLVTGLQPLIPTSDFTTTAATVLTAAGPGQFTGSLAGQARPAFSYLVLGGLYGWADDPTYSGDGDGEVRASELVAYAQTALDSTTSATQRPSLAGPDVALGRGSARGPDLLELGLVAGAGPSPRYTMPPGEILVDDELDYGEIAAQAEEANRQLEEATLLAEEANRDRQAIQQQQLATLRTQVLGKATADWSHIEPLLSGDHSAPTEDLVRAYLSQYGAGVAIRFDGAEEVVVIPQVKLARAYLAAGGGEFSLKRQTNGVGAVMLRVPSGSFVKGEPACKDQEAAPVEVTLTRSFWLMATEVTQRQYRELMGSSPSGFSGDTLPVEQVSWLDALALANALSRLEGLPACYELSGRGAEWIGGLDCRGYRLPTDAEWEYAAQAGQSTRYAGSAQVNQVGWVSENSDSSTHPVGQKGANAWGFYDMTGNVLEWVWDRAPNDYGLGTPLYGGTDPTGPRSGANRVLRGGSWVTPPNYAQVTCRQDGDPKKYLSDARGIRLARTAE